MRVLCLDGSDDLVVFHPDSLRDPPTLSYADRIDSLFVEWYQSSYIQLDGRAIPVCFWDRLYRKRDGNSSKAWGSFRGQWHNWKYIILEFEALGRSPAKFWTKYTKANGERMLYNDIIASLKAERKSRDNSVQVTTDAAHARMFFGGDLTREDAGHVFTYRKSGKVMACSRDVEVAKRWRSLLTNNDGIRARWEAFAAGNGIESHVSAEDSS
ncbi:hypothetical protein BV25DRAFT_1812062 [Artomyces pyxidatus]|uniref:Uncharacterized protein n=1 Tax=Artomyces pyxidatus TaxID=48021 RepID=A0ACB8SP37_9AGAM|nr:hypothetical protein BV25DRAFT_1812062 [Artomyces pyxidatus]